MISKSYCLYYSPIPEIPLKKCSVYAAVFVIELWNFCDLALIRCGKRYTEVKSTLRGLFDSRVQRQCTHLENTQYAQYNVGFHRRKSLKIHAWFKRRLWGIVNMLVKLKILSNMEIIIPTSCALESLYCKVFCSISNEKKKISFNFILLS